MKPLFVRYETAFCETDSVKRSGLMLERSTREVAKAVAFMSALLE